jgi:uracil phosphoribosyltransferase
MTNVSTLILSRFLGRPEVRSATNPPMPVAGTAAAPARPPAAHGTSFPVEEAPPIPLCRLRVAEHAAAQHALAVLLNRETSSAEFRTASNQLLVLLALEATRSLPLRDQRIETGAESWIGRMLAKRVIFLPVTRDGLGLSHTVAECLPGVQVGSISLERTFDGSSYQPRLHLAGAPALGDCRVILFDPVVSTGAATGVALDLVHRLGATDVVLLSFMICAQGLNRLQADYPELMSWTASIAGATKPEQDASAMLGKFRDRLFN